MPRKREKQKAIKSSEKRLNGISFSCMGETVPDRRLQYKPPLAWERLHEVAELNSYKPPPLRPTPPGPDDW